MNANLPLTGGCQCGAVRYAVAAAPTEICVCHCRECRKQSSSAFGISVSVRRGDFTLTRGAVKSWTRDTDSGRRLSCQFCPECGTRLWHERAQEQSRPTDPDGIVSVKGGTFDHAIDLTGATHYWVSRKLPGVVIPEGATCFAEEPP